MPRKRLPTRNESPGRAGSAGEAGQARQDGAAADWPFIPLVAFATLTVLYLLVFYGSDEPLVMGDGEDRLGPRRSAILFLSAPDRLLTIWCGGTLTNFSFLDRWPIAVLAGVILGGAWMVGRLALSVFGISTLLDRLERNVFGIGVGLNLLSLYALGVGLAGALQKRWVFVAPLAVLAVVYAVMRLRRPVERNGGRFLQEGRGATSDDDPRWLWWMMAALPFAVVIVLGGMLPAAAYDVREYHLQAPKEWYQNGRIDFLPHNIYANMPLGSELTSLWAMALVGGEDGWWWGATTGKTVMACYSLVAAAGLVALGRRIHSLAAGVTSAVIFLSTPWTVELAKAGYNEGPVALYALLAIHAVWLAERRQSRADRWRLIGLAGFCAGSAVACKYPPALFLVVPLALWVGGLGRVTKAIFMPTDSDGMRTESTWRGLLITLTLFLVAAAAGCGLWFGKNLVLARNPTYPLLYSLFDGRTRTPEKDRQWTQVHRPQPNENGNRFMVQDLGKQLAWMGWRMPAASVAIVPLALMALLAVPQRGFIAAATAWMLFVFAAWWLFTHRLDRFLMLTMPLSALIAALGAVSLPQQPWRVATLGLVVWGVAAQFPLVTLTSDNRFFAPLAALRRDDKDLGDEGGRRLHPAQRWLNEHARMDQGVLLVGDAEPFELVIPAVYNSCFDDCQFTQVFQNRSREERLAALQAEKIAYVFFHWPHLARFRSPGNYGYTSDYPTPQLVHDELVGQQRLLRKIELKVNDIDLPWDRGELFEVMSR